MRPQRVENRASRPLTYATRRRIKCFPVSDFVLVPAIVASIRITDRAPAL